MSPGAGGSEAAALLLVKLVRLAVGSEQWAVFGGRPRTEVDLNRG